MNAYDVLKYGHSWLMRTIEGLPESAWDVPTVCGIWSAKDVIAHLASYEIVLVEILSDQLEDCPTPYLDQFTDPKGNFNDGQVDQRKDMTPDQVVAEYSNAHQQVLALVSKIPAETLRQ